MGGRSFGWLVVGLGLLATGCPNPNLYGTPRTVPAGKIAGFAALEGVGWSVKTKPIVPANETWNPDRTYTNFLPLLPTFGGRVGVVDGFDIGFRLAGFSTPGADLKWNFLKTDPFDLAVDAGVEYAWFTATRVHLPLLMGINFSEKISLVLLPGAMYSKSAIDNVLTDNSTFRTITSTGGWYGRLGVGLNVRFNKKVALQPEVTFIKAFKQEKDPFFDSVLVYNIGVGISFGNLPEYGPPEEPTSPPQPAPATAPAAAAPAPSAAPPAASAAPADAGSALPPPPPPPAGAGAPTGH